MTNSNTFFFSSDIQSGNNTSKDSSNQKAESGALIEVAKSKIHQVSVCILFIQERWFQFFLKLSAICLKSSSAEL